MSDKFALIFSYFSITMCLLIPPGIFLFFTISFKKIKEKIFLLRYGSLYSECDNRSRAAVMFHFVFTLRRVIFVVTAIVFNNHTVF